MLKKLLSMIIAICYLTICYPITVPAAEADFSYSVNDNGEATLTAYNAEELDVVIPGSIDGYTVSALGDQLFYASSLTSVVIPNTVKKIGNEAFVRNSFEEIIIPDSVESIGNSAFNYNYNLKNIIIGSGVNEIGEKLFYRCNSLESISVSNNNNYLCSENGILYSDNKTVLVAFPSALECTSFTVPDGVIKIESYAFEATKVKSINFNQVETIDENFNPDTLLEEITAPYCLKRMNNVAIAKTCICTVYNPNCIFSFDLDGSGYNVELYGYNNSTTSSKSDDLNGKYGKFTFISLEENYNGYKYEVINGEATVNSYEGEETYVKIPDKLSNAPVTKINNDAFSGNTNIETLIIPDTVKEIGKNAFSGCTNIKTVYFPCSAKVTSKDYGAFSGCDSIENVTITKGNGTMPNYSAYLFFTFSLTYYKNYPWNYSPSIKNITLEEGIKNIGNAAFAYHNELESFNIPASVETISNSAFLNCENLKNIIVDSENPYLCDVDGVVFSKDKKILYCYAQGRTDEFYSIPAQTEQVVSRAFLSNNIKVLYINKNVNDFTCESIRYCKQLEQITVHPSNEYFSAENGVLFNKDKTILLRYPPNKADTEYSIPESVKSIGAFSFQYCPNVRTINTQNGIEEIKEYAFESCTALTSFTIPKTVRLIERYAFSANKALSKIYCYSNDCEIDSYAFNNTSTPISGCPGSTAQAYASEHSIKYNSWGHSLQNTFDEEGAPIVACTKCNYWRPDASGHTDSHTVIDTVVQPTCTAQGYTKHKCSDCGYTYIDSYTDELGHDYEEAVTEPSCTAKGYTTYTCSRCNDSYKDNYTDKTEHNYLKNVVEPTCTENGYTVYTCSRCNDSYIGNYTDKTEHNYLKTVVEPTCTENGYTVYTCTNCNDSYKDNYTDKTEHNYLKTVVDPTCTENGYTVYTCTNCNDSYIDDYTKSAGHSYVEIPSSPASCISEGKTAGSYCSKCGDIETQQQVIPKIEHIYDEGVISKQPTCSAKGEIIYSCINCGSYYTAETEMAKHEYKATVAKRATAESDGELQYRCIYCNKLQKTERIAAIKEIILPKRIISYTGGTLNIDKVLARDTDSSLIDESQYKITYVSRSNHKETNSIKDIGQYKIKVTFFNNYNAEMTGYISVLPKKTIIKKLKRKKGKATVKWRATKNISGYQILVSENKKFTKNVKAYNVKKSKKSKTIKKLKKKKRYYFKIRTFKKVKVDGKTTKMYSEYSKIRSLKIK